MSSAGLKADPRPFKLEYVAITGADDAVAVADLNRLAREYPFVEWAILLMPEAMGQNRFPTAGWIRDFAAQYQGAHKAMHLCGSALLRFIDKDAEILALMAGFSRIQLNLHFGDVAGRIDHQALIAQIKAYPEFTFVIQYTDADQALLPLLADIPNHALLFDGSAGTGMLPQQWPEPISGHQCGYAGGLNPANIQDNIEKIAAVSGDYKSWIDMESGVRTDDQFDLAKVEQVLALAAPWVI